jgi:hypothetical protein
MLIPPPPVKPAAEPAGSPPARTRTQTFARRAVTGPQAKSPRAKRAQVPPPGCFWGRDRREAPGRGPRRWRGRPHPHGWESAAPPHRRVKPAAEPAGKSAFADSHAGVRAPRGQLRAREVAASEASPGPSPRLFLGEDRREAPGRGPRRGRGKPHPHGWESAAPPHRRLKPAADRREVRLRGLARRCSRASPSPARRRSRRERSEPPSLPQAVLGEGQARSARERAPGGGEVSRRPKRTSPDPERTRARAHSRTCSP